MNSGSASSPEEFDLVILGSGAGSKVAAWEFASRGQRVAVIERKYVGGSCPNIACLPSKNIIHSAQVASYARHSAEFGLNLGDVKVNMAVVRERKRTMVSRLVEIHLELYRRSGAELIMATGRFVAPKVLEATLPDGSKRFLTGKNIIVGTGTHATLSDIPGLAEAHPLTHVEALELDTVPDHLIIVGAGYVGLEFAQAMRRFGSKVTLVDHNDRLVQREDPDVSEALHALLRDEGVEMILGAEIRKVEGTSGEKVKLLIEQHGEQHSLDGTHLLVAASRTPNTRDIGLDIAGVQLTPKGYIQVNEKLETTAPGIWAIGEVAGSPQFTHVSEDDFRVFESSLSGGSYVTTGRLIPYCLFVDPELARVGLNEQEAQAQGITYRLFKAPMVTVLRANALMETRGFMKALVAEKSDQILGFMSFGVGAGEVMSAVQIAMIGGLPYTALRDALIAHPTMVEGLHSVFSAKPVLVTAR